MKKTLSALVVVVMICSLVFVGCQSTTDNLKTGSGTASATAATSASAETSSASLSSDKATASMDSQAAAIAKEFDITPLEFVKAKAMLPMTDSIGPNGEKGVGVSELLKLFKPGDKEKIKAMGLKGAITMHTTASDFATSQLQGMKSVFNEFGIKLIAETDSEFNVAKSVSDFENVIAMKPDIVIHFVVDSASSLPLIKKAAKQGTVVSLIDSIPPGISDDDYAGTTMADGYANGYAAAKYLAEQMGGKGEVALINFVQDLYHTNQRTYGARAAFKEFPGIKIVDEQQHDGTTQSCSTIAEGLITAHPNLGGIWTVWDMPGMAAVAAVENHGLKNKIKVVSVDLSQDIGYDIAAGGACIGLGAQHPYDQGVAEALQAVAKKLGYKVPKYVLIPGELVTKGTLDSFSEGWKRIYHAPLPDKLKDLYNK